MIDKTVTFILLAILITPFVAAGDIKLIKTEIEVEWETGMEFTVITEGDDKTFKCQNTSTPSDYDWDITLIRELNLTGSDDCYADREVLEEGLIGMIATCNGVVGNLSKSISSTDNCNRFCIDKCEYKKCNDIPIWNGC